MIRLLKSIKTKMQKITIIRRRFVSLALVLVGVAMTFGIVSSPIVNADQFTQQIQQLEQQNNQNQQNLSNLQGQAATYQTEINQLQAQINALQAQIAVTQNNIATTQAQIQANEVKLAQEKATLDEIIKSMYINGNMTTLEMLATSNNISDFVTKIEYQNIVQSQIQNTLASINATQATLKQQNIQLNNSLANQTKVDDQLGSAQSQQNNLLSYNQGQQQQYNQQVQANNSQISQLEVEEIAANQSGVDKTLLSGGACGGSVDGFTNSYPASLCDAPQDSIVDPWNMWNRECVSYAAWMVSQESSVGNNLLQEYNFGNATDWPANAIRYGAAEGVTVSSTPQAGDIAIRPAIPGLSVGGESDVGHAMYVEAVLGSNTILVSEYNEDFNGDWSVQERQTNALYNGHSDNLVFIHFPSN